MKKTRMHLCGGRELINTGESETAQGNVTDPRRLKPAPITAGCANGATLSCLAFSAARGHHGSFGSGNGTQPLRL